MIFLSYNNGNIKVGITNKYFNIQLNNKVL